MAFQLCQGRRDEVSAIKTGPGVMYVLHLSVAPSDFFFLMR